MAGLTVIELQLLPVTLSEAKVLYRHIGDSSLRSE
jgi:hypothetical protein